MMRWIKNSSTNRCILFVVPVSKKASAKSEENNGGQERRQGIAIFAEGWARSERSRAKVAAQVFSALCGWGCAAKKPLC
jgi:hypothetical protein